MNHSPDDVSEHHAPAISPAAAAAFAVALLALGFFVGYGFHNSSSEKAGNVVSENARPITQRPPIIKGLRVSPDGKLAAFAAVVGNRRAFRVVADLESRQLSVRPSPLGWQDYLVQWNADGTSLLFDREKIPRAVEDAKSGLHAEDMTRQKVDAPNRDFLRRATPRPLLTGGALPYGEKSTAGFWTPNGDLIVKTRLEPKALYQMQNGRAIPVDKAAVTYYQNRAVRENGKLAFYVVRDIPGASPTQSALFRVEGNRATQISAPLGEAEWIYVAEGARWMIVCRDEDDANWRWELFAVNSKRAVKVREASVTKDVIGVFWSPDGKAVLGASGKSLWLTSIPNLQTRKLGARDNWNADDADWIPAGKEKGNVVIAAAGAIWIVNATSGAARQIVKLPAPFWNPAP